MALFFFLLVCVVAQLPSIHLSESFSTGERYFIDQYGRQRFFHGVNAVVKGPPWIPNTNSFDPVTSLVDEDFQLLQYLGLNVLRLGTMWPGAEPSQGQFNQTYLDLLRNITLKAASYGIYTFLDMHQDVLSEKFCGEGAPAWAVYTEDVPPEHEFPWPLGPPVTSYWDAANKFPLQSDCMKYDWGTLYLANADGKAFQALYQNTAGIRDAWVGFWTKVVQTFSGDSQILGVELINEPWAGDVDSHPELLIPGQADKNNLQPAYDAVAPAIIQADPDRLIFFAAVTWDDVVPVGFSHAPGGDANTNRSVFAFHYYEPPQDSLQPYFDQRLKDAQRLGTGFFLTEFGGDNINSSSKSTFDQVATEADTKKLSWAIWEFKDFCVKNLSDPYYVNVSQWDTFGSCKTGYGGHFWNMDGTYNTEYTRHYSRTYPHAVAGTTISWDFNDYNYHFSLSFTGDPKIDQPTVIYLNVEYFYAEGYVVEVKGDATWKSPQKNYIEVYNLPTVQNVTVIILPKI